MQKRSSPHSKASGKKRSSAGRDHNRNARFGRVQFGADTCVGLYEARRAEFLWSSSMRFALAASTSRRGDASDDQAESRGLLSRRMSSRLRSL